MYSGLAKSLGSTRDNQIGLVGMDVASTPTKMPTMK